MDGKYSIESLKKAGVDMDWIVLHEWIRSFRKSKNISVTTFLSMCGLDPYRRYYKKLCSLEMGICYRPSLREGTPGRKFRDAATGLMRDSARQSFRNLPLIESISNAVADWRIDNSEALYERGFHDVYVSGTCIKYYVIEGYNFPVDQFIAMISSDSYLGGKFSEGALTVQMVRCQLLQSRSCVGINDGVSSSLSIEDEDKPVPFADVCTSDLGSLQQLLPRPLSVTSEAF